MCYDYSIIEKLLPNKIRNSRDRPNVSGCDKKFCDDRDLNYKGYSQKIRINGKKKKIISYGIPCQSITFGKTSEFMKKGRPIIDCRANKDYPELYAEMKNMINTIDKNFKYNSITLNHNFKCKEHIDMYNESPSIIVAVGDFAGGEIIVEDCKLDIRYKPLKFNGSFLKHSTSNFCGERWSFVFYNK